MFTYKKFVASILLSGMSMLSADDKLLVGETQKIKIYNNGEQQLRVTHNVPEYAQATVEMVRLPEPQIMLHEGILNNSTQEILDAVKLGANVNLDIDGKLPIFIAMAAKKFNAAEVLKRCGAIVPSLSNMMYRAILKNSKKDIEYVLKAGFDIKQDRVKDQKTALVLAVEVARPNAVATLLANGADANVLLERALALGDIETALELLDMAPTKHKQCGSKAPVYTTVISRNYDILGNVLKIDPCGIKPAILEFVQTLIDYGYDINSNYSEPNEQHGKLRSAWLDVLNSEYFSVELLELLMKNGADPNLQIYHVHTGQWTSPLYRAIEKNDAKAVKFLLAVGADANKRRDLPRRGIHGPAEFETPVSYAQSLKHFDNSEIIQLLHQHNANATRDARRR